MSRTVHIVAGAVLILALTACSDGPSGTGGNVTIGQSASVHINDRPAARAASAALLAGDCAAALQQSPNVSINGQPATVVKPGASVAACARAAASHASPNVNIGD